MSRKPVKNLEILECTRLMMGKMKKYQKKHFKYHFLKKNSLQISTKSYNFVL